MTQKRLKQKWAMLRWITEFIIENNEEWEEERKERIEKERKKVLEWEKLTRFEKIKRIREKEAGKVNREEEIEEEEEETDTKQDWRVWRIKELEVEDTEGPNDVEIGGVEEEEKVTKIKLTMADSKLAGKPPCISSEETPETDDEGRGKFLKAGKCDERAGTDEGRGKFPKAGKCEGADEDRFEEPIEASRDSERQKTVEGGVGVSSRGGKKVSYKQLGIKNFLKAGNNITAESHNTGKANKIQPEPSKTQDEDKNQVKSKIVKDEGDKKVKEGKNEVELVKNIIKNISQGKEEVKEHAAKSIEPCREASEERSKVKCEYKGDKSDKMLVKADKSTNEDKKVKEIVKKHDKMKSNIARKENDKKVKKGKVKSDKNQVKNILKITTYFTKTNTKKSGEVVPEKVEMEESAEVVQSKVDPSQAEPISQAPASPEAWICSSQDLLDMVTLLPSSSHVTHHTLNSSQSNPDHLVTGHTGPLSDIWCLNSTH